MAGGRRGAGRGHQSDAEGRHGARPGHRTTTLPGPEADCDRAQLGIIRDLLAQDASPTATPEAAAVSRQVVYRVRDDPAKAEAMLAEWALQGQNASVGLVSPQTYHYR
jgi:hypothetical protein